jgi:beta-lactam-binding protein with PASTA domain
MPRIFVSYRREDAEGEAGRLFDDLVNQFGEASVFLDVAAIEVGRDFRKAIDESVATCAVLLAIIGKDWVDAKDHRGQRRLDDPGDFVRLETASALRRDIPVVPVLVRGAKMPRPEELPDDLKELAYRNGVELTHARWRSDLDVLLKALRPYVEGPKSAEGEANKPAEKQTPVASLPIPASKSDENPASRRKSRTPILITIVGAAIAIAALAYWFWPKQPLVPDLVGSTLSDATSKLEAAKLVIGSKNYQEDAEKPPDTVLSQSPSPDTHVKRGTAVDIVLAKRQALVEVPLLTGKSLDAAQTALQDRQLAVGNISREPKSDVAQDTVLDEFPKPGKNVDPGTAIDLVVAQAPAKPAATPTPGPAPSAPQLVRVPNLVGMTLDQARPQLKSSGLVWKATLQSKAGVDPGIVLSQDPAPGRQVQPGSRLDLTVSQPAKQPDVQSSLPNFAGTWQIFEYTVNGSPQAVKPGKPLVVTQNGLIVHMGDRDLRITKAGTVSYEQFYAHDDKYGHEVAAEDQADLVNAFTWRIKDSNLIFETISVYQRQYGSHPPGKDLRIIKYRRIAP